MATLTKAQAKWVACCRNQAMFKVRVKQNTILLYGTGVGDHKKRDRHPATPPGIDFVAKGESMFGDPWRSFSRTAVPSLAGIIQCLETKAAKLSLHLRQTHAAEVNALISVLQREDPLRMKKAVAAALERTPAKGENREDLDMTFQWVSDALDTGQETGLL